ncbi:MAG: hypothetical protein EOM48_06075 [Bacilli bacterium]|nr:hypothetical protein [Bacilli bacterium]
MISDEKLFDVAVEYYLKKKTQKEIAEHYNVSHVQIGKYLKEAEKRNIVTISVNLPISKTEEENLKHLFRSVFHIKDLVLVQGSDNSDKSHVRVVDKAADYILNTFSNNKTRIGYGWGKTMYDISLQKNRDALKTNWEYFPVCILGKKDSNPYYDSVQMLWNLAKNWGGSVDQGFVDKVLLAQEMDNVEILNDKEDVWKSLDALVCGMGSATSRYPRPKREMFSDTVYNEINQKDLVGDILHNFYDIDGNMFSVSETDILIPRTIISKIPWVVAVASGFPKVESIIGGLRTGLIDTLVTDVQTAHHVIDYLK